MNITIPSERECSIAHTFPIYDFIMCRIQRDPEIAQRAISPSTFRLLSVERALLPH